MLVRRRRGLGRRLDSFGRRLEFSRCLGCRIARLRRRLDSFGRRLELSRCLGHRIGRLELVVFVSTKTSGFA